MMKTQSIIVTGGNTGIGKAVAMELAKQKQHVAIVSRDAEKGKVALEEIKKAAHNSAVDLITGDLSGIQSTKALANNIIQNFPGASVLINNAGIWPVKPEINPDGLEMAFMVNHMAPFILSHMLLNLLKKNAPARIINVNAGLYVKGKVDIKKTPYGKDFGKFSTYMNTKLCNIFFTQKFAELIRDSGVTINAVHPGVICTNLGITKGLPGVILKFIKRNWDTPETGAQPPVRLAVSPEMKKINGRYFDLFTEKPYAKNANNAELSSQLWDLSMQLASL